MVTDRLSGGVHRGHSTDQNEQAPFEGGSSERAGGQLASLPVRPLRESFPPKQVRRTLSP